MITQSEIKSIDTYFEVLHASCYALYIRSCNTGHYWGILLQQHSNYRHYLIYHKHKSHYEYHRHADAKNINVAIQRIKQHDEFQLNGRKPIKLPAEYIR